MSRLGYLGFAIAALEGVQLATLMPDVGRLYQGCGSCPINLADQQTLASWLYVTLPLGLVWLDGHSLACPAPLER